MYCIKCGSAMKTPVCPECGTNHRADSVTFLSEPDPALLTVVPEKAKPRRKKPGKIVLILLVLYLAVSVGLTGYGYFKNDSSLMDMGLQFLPFSQLLSDSLTAKLNEADSIPASVQTGVRAGDYTISVFADGTCEINAFHNWEGNEELVIPAQVAGYQVVGIEMENYRHWSKDNNVIKRITIPWGVKYLGKYAFSNCNKLETVHIPNTVVTIGNLAFYDCDVLTSVTIPDSVTTIGDSAFCFCYDLTSVTIPDSVTTIGDYAFYNCDSLTSVTIPDSVTTIGKEAFWDCDSLTSVTIPDSVTTIGYGAFYNCDSLTSVTIPDSVQSIGGDCFRYAPCTLRVYRNSYAHQWATNHNQAYTLIN